MEPHPAEVPRIVKLGHLTLVTLLAIMTVALVVACWWRFGPAQVLTSKDWRLHVLSTVVVPGEDLIVEVQVCKLRPLYAVFSRQLVDTVSWTMPDQTGLFPLGCSSQLLAEALPKVLAPGTYRLILTASYEVNPLRTMTYRFESDLFEVAKPPPDRLAQVETTLYAPLETTPRRASTVEKWQVDRDRELRSRIGTLEKRLYRLENQGATP